VPERQTTNDKRQTNLNIPFFIARRYIVSKKSNNAINIISWISVGAVAIGTAALVIILSFMNGLTGLVKDLYNSFDPDIEITTVKGKTFIPDSLTVQKIRNIPGVKYLNFSIEDVALVKYGDKQTIATVKAVGEDYIRMSGLDGRMEDGFPVLKASDGYYIIMGKGIVYQLGVNVHDKFSRVSLFTPKKGRAAVFNPEDALIEEKLQPGGYFSINDEFDFKYVLIPIESARTLFEYEKEISTIDIGLDDDRRSDEVQSKIKTIVGEGFYVKNRFEQNKTLFNTLKSEKLIVFIVLAFILIVATFNIIGSLIMLIIEKKKDIVTLNNFGAGIKLIRKIFMTEGLLITLTGAISGLLLGTAFCILQDKFHLVTLEGAGTVTSYYPVDMQPGDFVAVIIGVFSIGVLAAWFPVRFLTKESVIDKFRVES
jgi:lipoprotein-releasing system permease protein